MSLKGRKIVSSRSSASSLCGVSGLHGSTVEEKLNHAQVSLRFAHEPSPSIIAKRSAAMSKSPKTLTAVMFGNEGTEKCFPGGNACRPANGKLLVETKSLIGLPACKSWTRSRGLTA